MGAQARRVGRYSLHGEIASGGMATVHFGCLAGPVGFKKMVAIKRLHESYARNPDVVSMFLDEARLVARIQHPNVVSTLDVCIVDGEVFLVMEYVPGQPLSRLLRDAAERGEQCPPAVAASIACNVLHGLHAAHQAKTEAGAPLGIIHRDVSPQNVLVGEDGVARVLDFGIAKALGQSHTTRTGELKGKLAYMAPELLEHKPATIVSDVYAAGVVLWEALATKRLFVADSEGALFHTVRSRPVPAPSTEASGIPAVLDEIVLRATAREPDARYPDAREMALAIERSRLLAPVSEVSAWVRRIAEDDLADRMGRVIAVESQPIALEPGDPPRGTAPPPPQRAEDVLTAEVTSRPKQRAPSDAAVTLHGGRQRRPLWFAAILAAAIPLALLLVASKLRPPAGSASVASAAAPAASSSPLTSGRELAPAPSAAPERIDDSPTGKLAEVPDAGPASTRSGSAMRRSVAPPRTTSHCDPPHYYDDRGHKRFKPECLR